MRKTSVWGEEPMGGGDGRGRDRMPLDCTLQGGETSNVLCNMNREPLLGPFLFFQKPVEDL